MLTLENIEVVYDQVFLAIKGVSLEVAEGGAVALLGSNGAGKSTTLKAISGLLAPERGKVTRGEIRFRGQDLLGLSAPERVRLGIAHVLEGRHVFGHLTPLENLIAATSMHRSRAKINELTERVFEWFPRLKQRSNAQAGYLSGGEQQMLAIARILRTGADLLLLDEPTEGLAPVIVQQIGAVIRDLKKRGLTVLLVEQNIHFAATVADRHYVVEHGTVVDEIENRELATNRQRLEAHLGV